MLFGDWSASYVSNVARALNRDYNQATRYALGCLNGTNTLFELEVYEHGV